MTNCLFCGKENEMSIDNEYPFDFCLSCDKELSDKEKQDIISLVDSCEYTDEVKCPWCGAEETDSWDYPEDSDITTCYKCGKDFEYGRNVEVTYTTKRIFK